jgi:kynurenine formamidase
MSISGIGGDFPSVDSANAQQFDFPIHRTLLGADRLVIENLCCLNKLPTDCAFDLCALPLKIDTDGSPARVVAVL